MSDAIVIWLKSTALSQMVAQTPWVWPVCEMLHFVGLALVIGIAGLFDLRLMGFMRSVPVAAVMQLRPWAALGIVINVITGVLFFVGEPAQYINNQAWWGKVCFLVVAMVNIVFFETKHGSRMLHLAAGEDTPVSFKVAGAVSMASWFLVMYFGRMLPFLGDAF